MSSYCLVFSILFVYLLLLFVFFDSKVMWGVGVIFIYFFIIWLCVLVGLFRVGICVGFFWFVNFG